MSPAILSGVTKQVTKERHNFVLTIAWIPCNKNCIKLVSVDSPTPKTAMMKSITVCNKEGLIRSPIAFVLFGSQVAMATDKSLRAIVTLSPS